MVNKSKIDAVFPGETDDVIQILDIGGECDRVSVEPNIDAFYKIFKDPGICRIIDAAAIDTSGQRCSVPLKNVKPMAALGMVLLTATGATELVLWSKVISTAAELIFLKKSDQLSRLERLINSTLDNSAVRRAVESMYEASFWDVMPLDSELDRAHSEERFVLTGKTRMLIGYETEFSKYLSDA